MRDWVMDVIDPGDPAHWPEDVKSAVECLAGVCREIPENTPDRPSYELSLGSIERGFEAESEFRALIGDRAVAYYHATRLLPHEDQMFHDDGLLVLSDDLRSRRLDRVIELYGGELGSDTLEALRDAGPTGRKSSQRPNRLGILHGVTPLDSVRHGGWGMEIFLTYWGGESLYFVSRDDTQYNATIAALSERSTPAIIEVAVRVQDLSTYRRLWPIFVARVDGWCHPWHEFSTRVSVPPERVLEILHPESGRWPLDIGTDDGLG